MPRLGVAETLSRGLTRHTRVFAFEHSEVARADPERVWALLCDVAGWPQWNPGVLQAELEGPMQEGAEGWTRAAGGPRSRLRIVTIEPGRRLVTDTELRLARLRFEHEILPEDAGVRIVHRVRMEGLAAPLYRRTVGGRLQRSIPAAVAGLAERAAAP